MKEIELHEGHVSRGVSFKVTGDQLGTLTFRFFNPHTEEAINCVLDYHLIKDLDHDTNFTGEFTFGDDPPVKTTVSRTQDIITIGFVNHLQSVSLPKRVIDGWVMEMKKIDQAL